MNILERYNEKIRLQKQQQEDAKEQKLWDLAQRIINAFNDEETVESIENYLLQFGSVSITDFGCLCQGGFCSWQKGLDDLLEPLMEEWEGKGIIIRPSLKLDIYLKGHLSHYRSEMTIEKIKEWNSK